MEKKKQENRKRRRGVDNKNKTQESQVNKFSKPMVDSLHIMECASTSSCENNIKVEEVGYTEQFIGLKSIPKSDNYFEDPNNWTNLNDEDVKQIVIRGPIQIHDYSFPKTNNRKFTITSYKRNLANGEFLPRTWLIYSKSQDSIYCFCCFLFATKKNSHALSSTGYSNWSHLSAFLKNHEGSVFHMENFKTWKFLEKKLELNPTIDAGFENSMRAETKHWIAVTERLFTLVKFLGSRALPFEESSDFMYDENNDNFLQLVKEVASFDLVLEEQLRRITKQDTLNKYFMKNIQHEIIGVISKTVTNKIVAMVKEAKYFSIIVDSTIDKSFRQHVTIVFRIVHNTYKTFEVEEYFLGFLREDELTHSILNKLECNGISLSNCRGQSYDRSSNMKAKSAATHSKIKTIESRAFIVPCCSHSLNLVVNDLARCSFEAVKFFDVVQCLYNFVSSSAMRWDLFIKNVPNSALIPLSETRWESSLEALKPLITNLGDIYEALIEISIKGNPEEKNTAESLGNKIFDFKFICCLFVWFNILEKINITSKLLQSPIINLSDVIQALQNTKRSLIEMRSDEKFNDYVQSAKCIALSLEIPTEFSVISYMRSRRIKREKDIDDSECRSEIDKFKVEFYFKILDQTIESITERFEQLKKYDNNFSFLNNISECSKNKNLRSKCVNLQMALSVKDKESKDIDGAELFQELLILSPLVRQDSSSLEVLNFILSSNLEDVAPNTVIALRILNTLPIIPSKNGFLKLKLMQNYLKNIPTQNRLEDLSVLAIENELVKSLDYDDLIIEFAKAKARLTHLPD